MKVNVAGAGAGKTTKIADSLTNVTIPKGKVLFCIALTNAAVDNIREKVSMKLGGVPDNIKISTIHSFLYQELIKPYYYFLYGQQFERLSVMDLPTKSSSCRARLSKLESDNILHFTKIPEKAKWIAYKKSNDSKVVKKARKQILEHFKDYCVAIYVDEAQDIGKDVKHIIESLNAFGVEIILYGDPKQDVKGSGCFREIINSSVDVQYINLCYRSPMKHLRLSNALAPSFEKQVANEKNVDGSIDVVYESDIKDIKKFLDECNFGLKYISMKRNRFATHNIQKVKNRFETLFYEVKKNISKKIDQMAEIEIDRYVFHITERMLKNYNDGVNKTTIIKDLVNDGTLNKLDKQSYAQMASAFKLFDEKKTDITIIPSIESIKGLEAERCLFILTTDLAPYLFNEKKEDNRTSHLLYVALTRSLDNLTFFVTREVEKSYTRTRINKLLKL